MILFSIYQKQEERRRVFPQDWIAHISYSLTNNGDCCCGYIWVRNIYLFHDRLGFVSDLFLFCGIVCNPTPDKSHRKEKICFWSADLDHDVALAEQKQIQLQMKIKYLQKQLQCSCHKMHIIQVAAIETCNSPVSTVFFVWYMPYLVFGVLVFWYFGIWYLMQLLQCSLDAYLPSCVQLKLAIL